MSRTNLILLAILAAFGALWAAGKDWDEGKDTGPAPRLFPDFNLEAADRIEFSGGWPESEVVLEKLGSDWRVVSAGGFPAKGEVADDFLEAVYGLRKENVVGSSPRTHTDTQTDDTMGRLVRVLKGDTPMAAFRVGKNPKASYQEVFVRKEGEDTVYRSRVVLAAELDKEPVQIPGLPRYGPRGYDWHNHVNTLSTEWVSTKIWDLAKTQESELWITRPDLDIKLTKLGDDSWEMVEKDKEKVPADADAAQSVLSQLRYLNFADVVGKYEDVRDEYGLDKPEITLVMTLKEEVEKKEEPEDEEPKDGEDEGEEKGEDEEEEKKPEQEWKVLKRTVEVGRKVTRPRDYRDGEVKTEDYYAIKVGGVFDDPEEEQRSQYVYLVSTYNINPLKKTLAEFRQEEEKKEEDEDAGKDDTEEGREDEEGKKDEEPAAPDDDDGAKEDDEPTADEPKEPAEPKKDEPTEPKKDDPKGAG